jgi:hypothetical protein
MATPGCPRCRWWRSGGRGRSSGTWSAPARGWRVCRSWGWVRSACILTNNAAVGAHLAQAGLITARGTLGTALQAEPHRQVFDGEPPAVGVRLHRLFKEMIDLARADEPSARQLFNFLAYPQTLRADFARARHTLLEAGVPEHFLPSEDEIDHAQRLAIEHAELNR